MRLHAGDRNHEWGQMADRAISVGWPAIAMTARTWSWVENSGGIRTALLEGVDSAGSIACAARPTVARMERSDIRGRP